MNSLTRRALLPLMAAAAVLLLLVGCQGTQPAAAPPAEGTPTAQAAAEAPLALDNLRADAIVAAQEEVFRGLYQSALPSVVSIRVGGGPGQAGEGSGFVWDDQGRIVTNAHVVQGAQEATVVLADRRMATARVLGADPDSDLAVLQLTPNASGLRPVSLGDSDAVRPGDMAIAIGNPFGQEFTMTTGIVSAVGRTIRSSGSTFSIPRVIQTDAAINPGNSGGPLLNRRGEVVGVNTQIISGGGGSSGIGFAVPINIAKRVVPALIARGKYEYAWLGISGVTLTPDMADRMGLPEGTTGTVVADVISGGPAEKAGLRGSARSTTMGGDQFPVGGDVITAIAGHPLRGIDDIIVYLVEETSPGDRVVLSLLRENGVKREAEVTLGSRPATP